MLAAATLRAPLDKDCSMRRVCILFLLALAAAPASAQMLAPQAETAPTPQLTPEQLLAQFHHDEINLLALRADAHPLLAAALMATPDAADKSRPAALKTPALLAKAQKFGADDTLVWWVTAGVECHDAKKACPDTETLQQLERTDAQNAAVWALAFAHAQAAKDDTTARAALTSAAQSAQYDDHFGALIAIVDTAAGILPVSEEILRAGGQGAVGTEGFKLTYAAGIAASLPQPGLRAIVETCKSAGNDASLAADCIAVAQKIADCGSLITRGYGIALLADLTPAGAPHEAANARVRVQAWLTQRIGELGERLAGDPRLTKVYVDALATRGQEIDAVQAVLSQQGVALQPPADWKAP
jgi:hypothetical protein